MSPFGRPPLPPKCVTYFVNGSMVKELFQHLPSNFQNYVNFRTMGGVVAGI